MIQKFVFEEKNQDPPNTYGNPYTSSEPIFEMFRVHGFETARQLTAAS